MKSAPWDAGRFVAGFAANSAEAVLNAASREASLRAELELRTDQLTVPESVARVVEYLQELSEDDSVVI